MEPNASLISRQLASIHDRLLALQELLLEERRALESRSVDQLAHVTAAKAAICEELADLLQGQTLHDLIEQLDPQTRAHVELDHKKLQALAGEAKDSNLVNGKILARSQQSTRELLTILSGRALEGLYGTTGHTDLSGEASSREIAKA